MGDIRRGWTVYRVPVGAVAVKLVDNSVHKNCILVKNLGPGTVWIHPKNIATQANGYPMGVNEAVSMGMEDRGAQEHERPIIEVWGVSDAASSVAILAETI